MFHTLMGRVLAADITSGGKPISPTAFMRKLRPERYSDTRVRSAAGIGFDRGRPYHSGGWQQYQFDGARHNGLGCMGLWRIAQFYARLP